MSFINGSTIQVVVVAVATATLATAGYVKRKVIKTRTEIILRHLQRKIKKTITQIKNRFLEQDLIVLGSKGVGKTTIHKFLREGTITIIHKATLGLMDVPSNIFKLGNLELKIKEGKDICSEVILREWNELFMECNICIYVFNVRKVIDDDKEHLELIDKHLEHIGQWNENESKDIYVFGLFLDKIKDLDIFSTNDIQDFKELINNKIRTSLLKAHLRSSKLIIGSMKDLKSAEFLIKRFLIRKRG